MKTRKRKIIIILGIILFLLIFVVPLGLSVNVYEQTFGERFETYGPMARSIDEFNGLNTQRYTFTSNQGQELVGYKYYRDLDNIKGVVIIAHGFGGGGHNSYMDVADFLASNDYIVFAYDATGNDESGGDSVVGMPQSLIDLDYAIQFVKQTPDFDGLPIMLFGHSWGAYSAGNVLNLHPDVKAIVMISGFNESMDIIEEEGKRMAGDAVSILMPYFSLYEKFKFGQYSSYSALDGFKSSDAGVMIIYSEDDEMISQEKSYDIFYEIYEDDPRFKFVKYENRGHSYIYYTDDTREYIDVFNLEFETFINSLDKEFTPEIKVEYLNKNLDKKLLFDVDEEFMNEIVEFYDKYSK
ncbi:MAG: alpha/beta fold hydrolase [Tissierellaceae bacterium]|nr:alpha/beta fold hydrolase [Tissierellaceae bacterium]